MTTYDYCVIGGGIVGLATAMKLLDMRPGSSLLLLEKEDEVAAHQTGHNSGVIHSGIYYEPGSFKAELCRRGALATKEFCARHAIPVDSCGKLIVATDRRELARMSDLATVGVANKQNFEQLSGSALRELEPNIQGLGALLVPVTAVVDFRRVARAMALEVQRAGGTIRTGAQVTSITETANEVAIEARGKCWTARQLVVCGGLQADRLARLAGLDPSFAIVPFRGEYYALPDRLRGLVKHLIYPVPDPALPFLGVHLTLHISGAITVGPNAVLGLAREGYRRGSCDLRDVRDLVTYGGMWKLARANVRTGSRELRDSLSRRTYLRQARKYCPSLTVDDLRPHEAGIRAQAVLRDGTLLHDFLFEETARMLHVCNAPSPAATSSIPIGELVAERVLSRAAD